MSAGRSLPALAVSSSNRTGPNAQEGPCRAGLAGKGAPKAAQVTRPKIEKEEEDSNGQRGGRWLLATRRTVSLPLLSEAWRNARWDSDLSRSPTWTLGDGSMVCGSGQGCREERTRSVTSRAMRGR